jgi:protein SCO1/2
MSGMMRIVMAATVALLALPPLLVHGPALGHDKSGHGSAEGTPDAAQGSDAGAKVRLLDLELIDKDGRTLRFESEAVGQRIVAIDFVYTTCTTICPILSAIMAQVQEQMAGRLGEEVRLISISIDPTRDTPRRLTDYAKKFDAGPDWVWLTGRKSTVDEVLIELGAYTPDYIDHPPMLVIGDAKRGKWSRLIGLPSPDDVAARLQALLAARQSTKTSLKAGD